MNQKCTPCNHENKKSRRYKKKTIHVEPEHINLTNHRQPSIGQTMPSLYTDHNISSIIQRPLLINSSQKSEPVIFSDKNEIEQLKEELKVTRQKLVNLENEKKQMNEQFEREKERLNNHYVSEKKMLNCHIETLRSSNEFHKQLIETYLDIINNSMDAYSHIVLNRSQSQNTPLEAMNAYSQLVRNRIEYSDCSDDSDDSDGSDQSDNSNESNESDNYVSNSFCNNFEDSELSDTITDN